MDPEVTVTEPAPTSKSSTIRLSVPTRALHAVLDAIGTHCEELLITARAEDDFSLSLTGITDSGSVLIELEAGPPLEGQLRRGQESVLLTRDGIKILTRALKDERRPALTLTLKTSGKLILGIHTFSFLPKKQLLRAPMTHETSATFHARPLLRALEDALGCVSRGLGTWTDGVNAALEGDRCHISGADGFHMVRSSLITSAHTPHETVAIHPQVCDLAVRMLRLGRPQSVRPALQAAQELNHATETPQDNLTGPESQRSSLRLSGTQNMAQWSGHAAGMRWSVRGSLIAQRPGSQVEHVCTLGQSGTPVDIQPETLSGALKMSAPINPHEVTLCCSGHELQVQAISDGSAATIHAGTASETFEVVVKPAMLRQGLEIYSRPDRACGPARMQISETLISLISEDQQDTMPGETRRVQYISTLII